ncbi:diguanylate cyclase (GGDEF)-like protein [Panacagrimonas perspica]|uniref:diguanylate cyclase n=1 Tax=Panacagrimonas perspica TaxID=381431 RepID=A0A4S3KCH2_9GAMM|nr:GGDEF domain-containing protein [Panacagrimonas perspica]TDU32701.1 diguanylate cyclase (GGDEF)-like protein [Panacagrimonas perspica]THD05584.1 hypothetical protein B1810_02380 [Panacagrimonas perspica]
MNEPPAGQPATTPLTVEPNPLFADGDAAESGEHPLLKSRPTLVTLKRLEARVRHGWGAWNFEGSAEDAYRVWHRKRFRASRTLLFSLIALLFLTGPLYQHGLLQVSEPLGQLYKVLDVWALGPLLILAAVLTALGRWQLLTQSVQSAAVMATLAALVYLHAADLRDEVVFPDALMGLTLIAIAYFGGFSWPRIALTALVCLGVRILLEVESLGVVPETITSMAIRVIEASIAILGAWSHERLARLTWIRRAVMQVLLRTDGLTGLSSRYDFDRTFARVLRQARREHKRIGVLLMDVDHFKRINDGHGHLVGDHVLRSVGEAIGHQSGRRPLDLHARFGGEEMVIVWYDLVPAELEALADSVIRTVRDLAVTSPLTGERILVTISAGLTWTEPGSDHLPHQVLQHADELLYQAKQAGRDQMKFGAFVSTRV